MKSKKILLIIISLIFLLGYGGPNMNNMYVGLEELKNIPQQNWNELANKKIYFGHQSVGFNIIDGIIDIMQEMPNIKLNIQETNNPNDFNVPVFAHYRIGKNGDPISKIAEFKKAIENGIGDKVDITFMKLCYVDIEKGTNIEKVFKYYNETMNYLESKYPKVKFIHFTVPLKSTNSGIKTKIKKFLGLLSSEEEDNKKRELYNQLLLKKYSKSKMVFNLSEYESTYPDGKKLVFQAGNQLFSSLIPEYTDDGGHLNGLGRKIIAKQLLLFLQSLI
jgi:hypothetical protein